MTKRSFNFAFLVLTFAFISCGQAPGKREYLEITKIPSSEQDQRYNKFSEFPVETQIDVFLFSQFYVEGGNVSFLRYMAADGVGKIPAILEKLDRSSDSDPRNKYALISVLDFIDEECHCVTDSPGVLEILRDNEMRIIEHDSEGYREFKRGYAQHLRNLVERKREH